MPDLSYAFFLFLTLGSLCISQGHTESRLFYSTYEDDYTPIFSFDPSSPSTAVLVRNVPARFQSFAVDVQTWILYYAAYPSIYATQLYSSQSNAVALLSGQDVRALKLVYENSEPVLYFTGCAEDDVAVRGVARNKRDSCPAVHLWRMPLNTTDNYEPCVVATLPSTEMDLVWDLDVVPLAQGSTGFSAFVAGRLRGDDKNQLPIWRHNGSSCGESSSSDLVRSNSFATRGWPAVIGDDLYVLYTDEDSSSTTLLRSSLSLDNAVTLSVTTNMAELNYDLALTKDEETSTLYYALGNNIVAAAVNGSVTSVQPRVVVANVAQVTALAFVRFEGPLPASIEGISGAVQLRPFSWELF